jgi:hypothetical protein
MAMGRRLLTLTDDQQFFGVGLAAGSLWTPLRTQNSVSPRREKSPEPKSVTSQPI